MHSWVLSIFICCTFITHAQIPKVFDYCYQNKKGICVYSLETKNELVISIKGDFPYISPDGKEITFTQNINGGGRNICTMNLTTNEIKVLKINSQSCFGSVWSPNGYFIAYNVIYKGENTNWGVAIIDTGNHKPINITSKGINEKFGYFSPTWSANSEFILAQNLDTLYIFNLKGKVKETIKIKDFHGSSASKFILTPDDKKIVFDSYVDDADIWGFGESPTALFIYDILEKKTTRLTPKGFCCQFPILKDEKIFFECYPPKSKIRDIYSIDLNGDNFKVELHNCWSFSTKSN